MTLSLPQAAWILITVAFSTMCVACKSTDSQTDRAFTHSACFRQLDSKSIVIFVAYGRKFECVLLFVQGNFYPELQQFLSAPEGARFKGDIVFAENSSEIFTVRSTFQWRYIEDTTELVRLSAHYIVEIVSFSSPKKSTRKPKIFLHL